MNRVQHPDIRSGWPLTIRSLLRDGRSAFVLFLKPNGYRRDIIVKHIIVK